MFKQLLICLFLGFLLSSCFNVREPESANAASEWLSPTQPGILIDNFSAAVKSLNVPVYDRCFTPTYRFRPDPTAAGTGSTTFENWGISEEHDHFNSLRNNSPQNAVNQLSLSKTRENFFNSDSLEQFYNYNLKTSHTDTTLKAKIFTGSMRLILTRRNNEWKIARWEDNKENQPCWTDLKKFFIAR